jgi:Aspartyl protease/PDZ domain
MLLSACAILIPLHAHAQDSVKKDPPKKFVVPFELIKTQHIVVNVKVNGKGPYRLVFDTGAPDSLISNKIAKEAGLKGTGGGLPLFGGRGTTKIKELELGELKAEDVSAMILDHPTVQAIGQFVGPIEGIIGFSFYSRYKMSIDYEKKQLTLEPGQYVPGDVTDILVKKLMARSGRETAPILAPAGLIGIRVEKASEDEAAGVTVKAVLPDSPAATAGIKTGDRLLTLDGRWTDTVNDTYFAAGRMPLDTPVPVQVLRDGKKMMLKLTVRAGL